jgi:NadR type nicotinamide-nucleotide adenylyltransferase
MLKRITITGPESTGKSWLAEQLAKHYQTRWVAEYAREYLAQNGPEYHLEDVIAIAKTQLEREEKAAQKSRKLLFCDTDMLVTKIWSEVVFGICPDWIEQQFQNHHYDLYLLCAPDIPWKPDPLRENPDNRDELFQLYKTTLEKHHFPFRVVKGVGKQRLENAINFVEEIR